MRFQPKKKPVAPVFKFPIDEDCEPVSDLYPLDPFVIKDGRWIELKPVAKD